MHETPADAYTRGMNRDESTNARRIILAGGSGFLGRAMTPELICRGYEVVILTRSPQRHTGLGRAVQWDGRIGGAWETELDGAAGVINLTGKSVNCRYTPANRREIIQSRINSVKALASAIGKCDAPPPVWVQSASLAIYGDAGDAMLDESSPEGEGFSSDVCRAWEGAFDAANVPATRKVTLRIGFALGRGGGALGTLSALTRWFLGGTVGSGRQYISWIHLADLNAMFGLAVDDRDMAGIFNATGPNPVTNALFMRQLRRSLHRPWSPPVPTPLVCLGARLMGTEAELALKGRRCVPRRMLERGFEFKYPELREALEDLNS